MARTSAAKKVIEIHNEERETKPVASNQLKLRLDNLKTFQPLTENQKSFFDAYKLGDYFIALHGVAGTGKTFIALYKAIEEVLDKSNPFNKGGQVYYDPEKGQYYTQDNSLVSVMFGGNTNGRSYMGSSPTGSSGSGSSFDNPSALPNYAMYIPPSQMPDINAYLQNPNSLLGALQSAGVPSAGAGRFSNLLSTNTKGK
jgi:hypothetical protein